jgi:hypothetical protein
VRKHLSADALIGAVRENFAAIADPRNGKAQISLADALMSAFAMFSLKDPSLLALDQTVKCSAMRGTNRDFPDHSSFPPLVWQDVSVGNLSAQLGPGPGLFPR